jgi:lipopolysaccharide cholinephosphotransferase
MERYELSMRENQQAALEIMKSVAQLCRELDLRYYLAYGSLIGAIRHEGFIPWDDDLDIWMPRADYRKLIAYFQDNAEALEPLRLFSIYNNADYPYMITRISDCRYEVVTHNEKSYGLGAFIDIYPMDGMGNTVEEYTALKNKASRYSSLCFLSTRLRCEKGNTKSRMKLLVKYPAFLYAKIRGKRYFMNALESMAKDRDYDGSAYIGCLVWGSDGIKCVFPRQWFETTVDVPFEGCTLKAPAAYDQVLRRLYGDYMKLPPEEDRIGHHFYRTYKK